MSDKELICEQCGTKNPPDAVFCLICGHDLSLPKAPEEDGDNITPMVPDMSPQDMESDLPELLRDLHAENATSGSIRRSAIFSQDDADKTRAVHLRAKANPETDKEKADWLAQIRKKAQEDEDARGELTKRLGAREKLAQQDSSEPTTHEFDEWLGKVKKTASKDGLTTEPTPGMDTGNSDETPSWLKKVRDNAAQEREQGTTGDAEFEEPIQHIAEWIKEKFEKEPPTALLSGDTHPVQTHTPDEEPAPQNKVDEADQTPDVVQDGAGGKQTQEPVSFDDDWDVRPGQDEAPLSEPLVEELWRAIEKNPAEELLQEQRSQADLLKALLATEGKSLEMPVPDEKRPFRWQRLFLAMVLLAAVIVPLFINDGTYTQKGTLMPASLTFFDQVEQLPSKGSILVVLDYPVGLSAEMEMVSAPVFSHLMQKGMNIALLSSQPEGIWLSQRLVEVNQTSAGLDSFTNLGYLPGSRMGMMNLATTGLIEGQLSLPALPEPILGVSLAKYDGLILITDSLQSARNWIELVFPGLVEKPALVISSMQEALMVMPYFDSGQVDGLLAGLQSASQYRAALDTPIQPATPWRSYQAGLLVMAGLLLVGIVIRLEATSTENDIGEMEP